MRTTAAPSALERAVVAVTAEVSRLRSLPNTTERKVDTFFELVSCILGSQVSFEMASATACQIRTTKAYSALFCTKDETRLERLISMELRKPISDPTNPCHGKRFRFWRTKAKSIARTAVRINGFPGGIETLLGSAKNEVHARRVVAETVSGVGPKQASLFLRNIGVASNLAILDVHVLRYMVTMQMMVEAEVNLGLLQVYERTESLLLKYATRIGYPLKYIDEAIWVVMRVAQRSEK